MAEKKAHLPAKTIAALFRDVQRTGCAVKIGGVRMHPCDSYGRDLTTQPRANSAPIPLRRIVANSAPFPAARVGSIVSGTMVAGRPPVGDRVRPDGAAATGSPEFVAYLAARAADEKLRARKAHKLVGVTVGDDGTARAAVTTPDGPQTWLREPGDAVWRVERETQEDRREDVLPRGEQLEPDGLPAVDVLGDLRHGAQEVQQGNPAGPCRHPRPGRVGEDRADGPAEGGESVLRGHGDSSTDAARAGIPDAAPTVEADTLTRAGTGSSGAADFPAPELHPIVAAITQNRDVLDTLARCCRPGSDFRLVLDLLVRLADAEAAR